VTALDQQRIAERIGDAFAILCVRLSGHSVAEARLRLGLEAIVRHLGIPPLGMVAKVAPAPYRRIAATPADLRQILKALDSSLAIFQRYEAALAPAERELQRLVRETRVFVQRDLEARRLHTVELLATSSRSAPLRPRAAWPRSSRRAGTTAPKS
jgi:sugar phosphate isomerase/epimerase